MKTTKIIGMLLIVGALLLGYFGLEQVQKNTASTKILGVELSASNQSEQQKGYFMLGLGVIGLFGGIYIVAKK